MSVDTLTIIAAVGCQGQLGLNGTLPWHIKADLQRFKQLTWGHGVLMGRKTFDSLGKPLPGRINFVLTRDPHLLVPHGCVVIHDFEHMATHPMMDPCKTLFAIGGSEIYRLCLPIAKSMHLSHIDYSGPADVWFPTWQPAMWTLQHTESFQATPRSPAWEYQHLVKS